MAPAAAEFSHRIPSSSQPVSQNPDFARPICNAARGPRSSCLDFDDKVSDGGLGFDFSNKGSRPLRVKHTAKKKVRGKVSVSENKDFSNVLRSSVNLNRASEASSVSANSVSGSLGKKGFGIGGGGGGGTGVDPVGAEKFGKGGSVFGTDIITSLGSNFRNENLGLGTNKSSSTASFSCGNESFVFGAGNDNLDSKFNNGGSVFGAEKSSFTSNSNHKNDHFVFVSDKISSGANSSNRDVESVSNAGESSSILKGKGDPLFGDANYSTLGGQKHHSGFSLGATKNCLRSEVGKCRTRRFRGKLNSISQGKERAAVGNDFRKANVNGTYGLATGTKEKSNSVDSDNCSETIKLDAQKPENGNASGKHPSDATSSFKFVFGSNSSPGSAFYKVPLSKLLEDMKGFNIDSSKGISGSDKSKGVGSNSWFDTDKMFSFESNGQTSSSVSGKEDQTFNPIEKTSSQYLLNQDQPIHNNNSNETSQASVFSSRASPVQQNGFGFDTSSATKVENKVNFDFTSTPVKAGSHSGEFKYEPFSFTANLFSGVSENSRYKSDNKLRKTRGKLRQRVKAKLLNEQDRISKEGSSPKTFESPGCYSPMDFSPYQDANKTVPSFACTSVATEEKEGNCSVERLRSDNNECDKGPGKQDVNSKIHQESNSNSLDQNGLSAIRRQYRKKYKLKVGNNLNGKTSVLKSKDLVTSAQFSSNASHPFHISISEVQTGDASNSCSKAESQRARQDLSDGVTNSECEQWRMRGNQAYKTWDLSKAEECYTNGINSARGKNVSGFHIQPLLLCYTNRAATRMFVGRLREALEDCKAASALDPSFLKAKLRAANYHLMLGEFQEAIQYFNYCLESGNAVCLDRRIVIEAGEGLQKAEKASEYMCQAANILQQRTSEAASFALEKIVEGLSISCHSERFLEMKGEALFLLRRYDEVIELCERTLNIAEKNFNAMQLANEIDFECENSVRLWRWCLMSKSQFHLGRLEVALDLIEKQENSTSVNDWSSNMKQESLTSLASTIQELLHRKKAGNEAFQSGKHVEAVEHYTAAISSSVDSRPFAAICFCNRAAAYQALGQIADAIADCSVAIALDGDYVKAVSRRATLHEMIRDYKLAITDLQKLVFLKSQENSQQRRNLEGSNARELKRAQRRLSLMEDKAKQGTPMDFYLILGIKASDAESEIKKAYRKAALKHHPDKAGQFLAKTDGGDDGRSWKDILEKVHEDADRLFKMIGEAYAVLSDPDKRAKYNLEEEIRSCRSDSKRNYDSGRPSDYYNSPYNKGHWSGKQSNFSSSTFERSRSRRYWQESWKSYASSHTQW